MSEAAEILKSCALFSGLDEDDPGRSGILEKLASLSLVKTLPKNRVLFREGEKAEGLYIVGSGRIKVFKRSPAGREQILHVFGPGDMVAEAAVFDRGTFPAHAAALEDSRILYLFREEFLRLIEGNPELIFGILSGITRKLREFAAVIEELALKDVSARLARYLLENARGDPGSRMCRLDISKSQLAALLGTVNETLSRTLGKLKQRGLISETNDGIIILDEETLETMKESGLA